MHIMNKTILLATLIICLATSDILAQSIGFRSTNERNHAHLKWISVETEHFIISFPEHLTGIELQAAPIAEATYEALSKNLNVEFDYKIRVNLSDEDEIVNGFAVPFRKSYTNIWVNLNAVGEAWSGEEKWLRTVLAHELAHIFHFEAVKSNLPIIGILGVSPSLPAPWTEGIAQYQTEPWHAQRGDAMLRTAFYDGRPSFRDGTSPRNRQLMYASGNSQLRYFADVYGDTTLAQILAHRQKHLGGRIQYHNFNKAFRSVTDKSFREFEDEWRRHMAIYYNTIAGQMERKDSLDAKPLSTPGLFTSDIQYSPDTTKIAMITVKSPSEFYRQLVVIQNDSTRKRSVIAEDDFNTPMSWSADNKRIAYSATTRGANGSIINDLYIVDVETKQRTRVTNNRRALYPVFSPDGEHLYFVANENGNGNITRISLSTGTEHRYTNYSGDTQLGRPSLHSNGTHIAYARFDNEGQRHIVVLNLENNEKSVFTDGSQDDRFPIWSPDGERLAFTSLRDYVPNIFVIEPFRQDVHQQQQRITALFNGGTAMQWLPADSSHADGTFIISAINSKTNNAHYRIDASRRVDEPEIDINPSYTRWISHTPPNTITKHIAPDASLIQKRYPYNSWKNITHVATIPFPYYSDGDFGAGAITTFMEPLGKHAFYGLASLSFLNFVENSLIFMSYENNQFSPTLSLNLYHNSFTGRIYERDYLVTTNSGAYMLANLPRDWIDSQFIRTSLYSRLRYEYTDATRFWSADAAQANLPVPESGWQTDLRLGLRITSAKPYAYNLIHPLHGWGIEPRVTIATGAFGSEAEYVRPDIISYAILPGGGDNRIYVYGRAVAQWGNSLAQDYIGFSRYDDIHLGGTVPGLDVLYTDSERVRGFSEYTLGNRLVFGTIEYRMPFMSSLNTNILGLVKFGRTTLAGFVDGGIVWSDAALPGDGSVAQAGAGAELKNVLSIGGLSIVQSLGFAQPVQDFATDRNQEIYYRIRAVIPF
jgi:hypothetical protein